MKRVKQNILENLIYLIIWLVVFIVPIFGIQEDNKIDWAQVIVYWKRTLPFLVLFLINNYLLIPYFLLRKRSWIYLLLAALSVFLLFTVPRIIMPREMRETMPPPMYMRQHKNMPADSMKAFQVPPRPDKEMLPENRSKHPQFRDGEFPPPGNRPPGIRMPFRMIPIINDWILALVIIGFNVAFRLLFKSIRDDRQIKELESHTLQAELDYLKAQINPHFFMNTLNNIHALIDIDTEKAKETVIELSKIMRYVLYDADQPRVLLSKEIQFLDNYIKLMQIRFTNMVEIQNLFPESIPDVKIPPLLLMTLIENAFKHGVSYQKKSYIYTILLIEDDKLHYTVENSISPEIHEPSGVGLENLQKRLSLLFGNNHSLTIIREVEKYQVKLIIPLES
ncbi:MAG: histidine kinase [Tannerella sp.]|jgi:hypothetical protein|nr:histidine kinase [Tannerella sp.]